MSTLNAGEVFAVAAANMVREDDVTGTLVRLLGDAKGLLGVQALAAIVSDQDGRLELLSATSHAVEDIEAYQIQQDEGPCVDCVGSGTQVVAYARDEMLARWPRVGPVITSAGYQAVIASPLHWHGHTFGALNGFAVRTTQPSPDQLRLAQSVADTAAVLIMSSGDPGSHRLEKQIRDALARRAVVEQAKGALAHQRSLDMAAAYRELIDMAEAENASITHVAERIMTEARNGQYRT
jgi:transcriptional regulator with GAF, ATPase, and Fis domain